MKINIVAVWKDELYSAKRIITAGLLSYFRQAFRTAYLLHMMALQIRRIILHCRLRTIIVATM